MMGENNFSIEGMTLYVNGALFGTIEKDEEIQILEMLTTSEDEEIRDPVFLGITEKDYVSLKAKRSQKALHELFFGPCKSGRWRLREKAIKIMQYRRIDIWLEDIRDEQ